MLVLEGDVLWGHHLRLLSHVHLHVKMVRVTNRISSVGTLVVQFVHCHSLLSFDNNHFESIGLVLMIFNLRNYCVGIHGSIGLLSRLVNMVSGVPSMSGRLVPFRYCSGTSNQTCGERYDQDNNNHKY